MTDIQQRVLQTIRSSDHTLSLREIMARAEVSSTSVVAASLHRLAELGYLTLRGREARGYQLLCDTTRVAELETALRTMRRWIENEERPGDSTTDIYNLTAKLLPY